MSVRDVLRRAAQIGPRALGYRALWEASNRSGLRQLTEPAGAVPVPPDLPSFAEWSRNWPEDHLLRGIRQRSQDASLWSADEELLARARNATRGGLVLFGHHAIEAGNPPNFLSEPIAGTGWPAIHWSRVMEEHVGDPRTTWELNRFGWVWDWVRASPRDSGGGWGAAFAGHLVAWDEQNPFRVGINWVSGQELALRVLAWCAGAAVFADTVGFGEADFRRFWKLVYWHGYQIEAQLDFARLVVPNNHLLAESLMLAIIADLAGSARSAAGWRERGLAVFQAALPAQFRDDGGYCQNSHRYHRYALELVLLADRWFPELRYVTEPVLEAGFAFFRDMVVAPGSGEVPNFGPNDGATAFRLSSCADGDVRPLLATLAMRLQQPFECGPWDEQAAWLYGATARPVADAGPLVSRSFPESGLHVLRSGQSAVGVARRRACRSQGWTAYLRCGATSSRGGHADQLHVDVWKDGAPVAIDAGSARYFDSGHRWHIGTASHNTVTVDGRDQQKLAGRFTWLDDAPCHLAQFDAERGRAVGCTEAYLALGILHERELVVGDEVTVIDLLTPVEPAPAPHLFRLHWLLPESLDDVQSDQLEEVDCFTWNISTPRADIVIEVQPLVARRLDASLDVVYERHAPAYGAGVDAAGIVVDARGYGVKFVTTFRERR